MAMSNSGRTAEVIRLYTQLQEKNHSRHYSLTAFPQSTLESLATSGLVLGCGKESAVAATKSVIEQGLVCRALIEKIVGKTTLGSRLKDLAAKMHTALKQERIKAGLTQNAVAQVLGVTVQNYSQKEAGQRQIKLVEAQALAHLFSTTVEQLFPKTQA